MLIAASAVFGGERLDRGGVAFPRQEGGVYVGWRLLVDDPPDIGFDVYRSDSPDSAGKKLNATPITTSTNYVDSSAGSSGSGVFYRVRVAGRRPAAGGDPGALDVAAEVGG